MRVISGTARGLKLTSLPGDATRPTLDNVKEAIFSMLFGHCGGAKVLDLFAGSASLGIEALSRGADDCTFVDCSHDAIEVIHKNLSLSRTADKSRVLLSDYKKALASFADKEEKFDIIFLDPPYGSEFLQDSLDLIHSHSLLAPGGVVVAEFDFPATIDTQNFTILKEKKYGRVGIYFLEAK